MLKYPCLVLDHDDTVVQSESTVNYPCFCEYLAIYRPGMTMTLSEYVEDCSRLSFLDMCKERFGLTDEEMQVEYAFWQNYARTHIPCVFDGIGAVLKAYRQAGGKICVVSMSAEEQILRDYRYHFAFMPDRIYGCDLPKEQQKPGIWPIRQIEKEFGFSTEQILVVDDMKFAVNMAKNAGCPIAFAGWGRKDHPGLCLEMEGLCDYSFYTVEEFANFLFA